MHEWPPAERTVHAEVTAPDTHVGIHRYTFPPINAPNRNVSVLFDVCHTASADADPLDAKSGIMFGATASGGPTQACHAAVITVDDQTQTFSGWVDNKGALTERAQNGSVRVHFAAQVVAYCNSSQSFDPRSSPSVAAVGHGAWADFKLQNVPAGTSSSTVSPTNNSGSAGAFLVFPRDDTCSKNPLSVEVAVGISFIDAEHAEQSLQQSLGELGSTFPFDAARRKAQQLWRNQLSIVSINNGSTTAMHDEAVKFYSSLYRASLSPTVYTEKVANATKDSSGKEYMGFDGNVHQWQFPADSDYHSDMSIWDIHRTQLPWLLISNPPRARDIARSLVQIADDGGRIPRWPLASVYTGCMIGDHGFSFIADACVKGTQGMQPHSTLSFRFVVTSTRTFAESVICCLLLYWQCHIRCELFESFRLHACSGIGRKRQDGLRKLVHSRLRHCRS